MNSYNKVLCGADRLGEDNIVRLLKNERIGVVSAACALNSEYRYTIDLLNEKFTVGAIYAPEHGARGVLGPGEKVSGGVDKYTKLPVFSLYDDLIETGGSNDDDEILSGITTVVFDLQDVGSRYFTYASTLFNLMKMCAKRRLPLVLLDRPNPIGSSHEGSVLKPEFSSFIGLTEVPIRHGMTIGELARFYNGHYSLHCELEIVQMQGYRREMYFEDTQLPFVNPSPNLPTLDSIALYNGTCMLSGTNISEGRGTTTPFVTVGAPYIDPFELCQALDAKNIAGVKFSPCFFMPQFSKYKGEAVYGVRIHITDKRVIKPTYLGLCLIRCVQELYPNDFAFREPSKNGTYHIDLSTGSNELRTSDISAERLFDKWQAEADKFARENEKYRIYE